MKSKKAQIQIQNCKIKLSSKSKKELFKDEEGVFKKIDNSDYRDRAKVNIFLNLRKEEDIKQKMFRIILTPITMI